MSDETQNFIRQRGFPRETQFRFRDDHLDYAGPSWDFKVRYEEIHSPSHYRYEKKSSQAIRIIMLYYVMLAIVLLYHIDSYFGPNESVWTLTFVTLFVAGSFGVFKACWYIFQQDYTVVPTNNGNLKVRSDEQRVTILETLQAYRLQSLRKFAEPDEANSPEEEAAKLKWLLGENAISRDECNLLFAQQACDNRNLGP